MPMESRVSTTIDRPPATVFAWLADLEQLPRWETSFAEVRRESPGPIGVGTRYWCRRTQPTKAETHMVVTEYEPERRLMVQSEWAGFIKPEFGYEVEPAGAGTRVTLIGRPRLRGVGLLMTPMIALLATRLSARYLANLKRLVEEGEPRGTDG
jgi:uncharacterized protein YndB with AHSA1/START domain